MENLPRLLDVAPVPGVIKEDYTDFLVEEIPLYPASGAGTHVYFLIEKTGLSTMNALNDVARALNVKRRDIGFAGLKDARSVSRQWLSVEHIDSTALEALEIPRIRVLEITRHTNKLKLGHLRGNRFDIRVRDTQPERLPDLQAGLAELGRRGVPNYFGEQRFGGRGDTGQIGRALLHGNVDAAIDLILGQPGPLDHGEIRRARKAYERGDYQTALKHWPGMFQDQRRALKALLRTGKKLRALGVIDQHTRAFYISAYQSELFNRVVARRLPAGLERLCEGDLAWRHANGAVFRVEDPAAEQPRANIFEISPSGPLFGQRMTWPEGQPAELERGILEEEQIALEAFKRARTTGGRRPLRFPVTGAQIELGADERGPYFALQFTLPRGCYATALLRELFAAPPAGPRGLEEQGTERPA